MYYVLYYGAVEFLIVVERALSMGGGGGCEYLKVHKNENFFGFDFEFCTISLLVMSKY